MRLRIQNFKSYVDTGFLDLKPLTLIFGKNSAGKSAVIQALNSLSTSNLVKPLRDGFELNRSKSQLSFYGETWDLGDFARVVHKRDLGTDIGFEFELKFLGEEMRSVVRDLRAKKLKGLKAQLHELKEQRGIPLSLKMQFSTPGHLSRLSITSPNTIAINSFVSSASMMPRSLTVIPKDDPVAYGPMVIELLRSHRKLAENFSREIQKFWVERADFKSLPLDAPSKYSNPASLRREKHKARRQTEWLASLEDVLWLQEFNGPEDFIEKCSDEQFIKFISSELVSSREILTLDRIDRQLHRQLMDEWELPKLDLVLKPLTKEFVKAVTQHNRKARNSSGFVLNKNTNDLFLIDHQFVMDCFKTIGNKRQADYWVRKLDGIRVLIALGSTPFIFPVDVTGDTPRFISDDPVSEFGRNLRGNEFNSLGLLAKIISKAFDALRDELRGVKHVPAFRGNPRRTIDRDSRDEIAKSLDRLTKTEIKRLNAALKLIGWSQEFDLLIESESGENRKIPRLTDFSKGSGRRKKKFETLADVGFGFSQLFPIVEKAISDTPQSFLIEEPEVHLHPSLQGDLIELIARNSLACTEIPFGKESSDSPLGNKHKWFIETHSEYMLRRVQKLIARGLIDSKQVAVYFCDIDDQGERLVREIKLGSKGQMLTPWPNDFIETDLEASSDRVSPDNQS